MLGSDPAIIYETAYQMMVQTEGEIDELETRIHRFGFVFA